jgi:hypothetical protein
MLFVICIKTNPLGPTVRVKGICANGDVALEVGCNHAVRESLLNQYICAVPKLNRECITTGNESGSVGCHKL